MKRKELFDRAVELRKMGKSYKEIHNELGVAKSTASEWLKGVELDENAIRALALRRQEGQVTWFAGSIERRRQRDQVINKWVFESLSGITLSKEVCQLLCSFLYWGEGTKTGASVQFMNSDPEMIKTFLFLFRKGFEPIESKFYAWLHLHEYHNKERQIEYWSEITSIPSEKISVYLKPHTSKIIRANYPGCIRVSYGDIFIFKQIQYLYKQFNAFLGA